MLFLLPMLDPWQVNILLLMFDQIVAAQTPPLDPFMVHGLAVRFSANLAGRCV